MKTVRQNLMQPPPVLPDGPHPLPQCPHLHEAGPAAEDPVEPPPRAQARRIPPAGELRKRRGAGGSLQDLRPAGSPPRTAGTPQDGGERFRPGPGEGPPGRGPGRPAADRDGAGRGRRRAGCRTAVRRKEEAVARKRKAIQPEGVEIDRPYKELQIHQTELEEQNRELREIQQRLEESRDLPKCWADLRRVGQALLNLITNADQSVEGRKGPRRLEIRSFRDGEWIVITVSDSGPGIPVSLREKIFDPYFTTKPDGTGIGLSFSHRVVAAHGGILTAGKSSFGGAEFRIRLPLHPGKGGP